MDSDGPQALKLIKWQLCIQISVWIFIIGHFNFCIYFHTVRLLLQVTVDAEIKVHCNEIPAIEGTCLVWTRSGYHYGSEFFVCCQKFCTFNSWVLGSWTLFFLVNLLWLTFRPKVTSVTNSELQFWLVISSVLFCSYWAIQQSWFARVNVLCNLLRKKSRGHSALPGRFLSRLCFTLCITVEVEPRIMKQYKCQYCCRC